ncbi:MAG: AzlC family ABC transporter permease, partial [Pseudomonadota bacterium]
MKTLQNNTRASVQGCVDILPLAIACIPWGILTGALAVQAGLSNLQAQVMSLIVFAGAAQISGLSMIASGVSPISILGSTFVISSRHLLYSIRFRQHVDQLSTAWRLGIGFLLTDEMFAVSEAHTRKVEYFDKYYAFYSGLCFWVIWNLST